MFIKPSRVDSQMISMKELLLVVDKQDKIKRFARKIDCHKISEFQNNGICHRAFSLFLFDDITREILIQKRSAHKLTFPGLWSNSICSHPILNEKMNEIHGRAGIINAVNRRFEVEMGYNMPVKVFETLKCVGRMIYSARSSLEYIENEVDYIVFGKIQKDQFSLKFNDMEIESLQYSSIENLRMQSHFNSEKFTPWFSKISKLNYIEKWMEAYFESKESDMSIVQI